MSAHSTHPKIIKRLKQANGHLNKVVKMLEEDKPCLDVAQQLHAVESAIKNAKKLLIQDHIDHCLEHAVEEGKSSKEAMQEFKEITKYL